MVFIIVVVFVTPSRKVRRNQKMASGDAEILNTTSCTYTYIQRPLVVGASGWLDWFVIENKIVRTGQLAIRVENGIKWTTQGTLRYFVIDKWPYFIIIVIIIVTNNSIRSNCIYSTNTKQNNTRARAVITPILRKTFEYYDF